MPEDKNEIKWKQITLSLIKNWEIIIKDNLKICSSEISRRNLSFGFLLQIQIRRAKLEN